MNIIFRVLVLSAISISTSYAASYQILNFQQAIDLKPEQSIELEVEPLNANAQFWTATVIIANQGLSDRQAKMQLQIQPTGALNKSTPAQTHMQTELIAGDLLRQDQASFEQLTELVTAIQTQKPVKILATTLEPSDPIRVYADVVDWVPQYDHQGAMRLSVSVPEQNGFYPSGVYVLVGQGEYPEQLKQWASSDAHIHAGTTPKTSEIPTSNTIEPAREPVDGVKSFTTTTPEPIEESGGLKAFMVQLGFLALLIVAFILWRKKRAE